MGYTWIYDYEFKEKLFGVTSVFGHKKKTYGHQARHALWARRGEIFLPSKYFISSYGGPDGSDDYDKLDKHVYDKKRAFSCQYHIAIENSDNGFYFSEKLIDCFQTKVVPIYWGTPNIGNYFNPDGMLIARSIDEIIEKANSVQHDDYERMLPAIEENYERSKQWCLPPDDRLITKLRELIQ
ncbi:hypothetical protein DRH27_04670 [Candidatus Falkowbacteria bacterium]|nr:MAG: hypothetical protein DRH27_04670 [Candidatus Falkowbacteria bacterium]